MTNRIGHAAAPGPSFRSLVRASPQSLAEMGGEGGDGEGRGWGKAGQGRARGRGDAGQRCWAKGKGGDGTGRAEAGGLRSETA